MDIIERACKECGKFHNRESDFCSRECERKDYLRSLPIKYCEYCGKKLDKMLFSKEEYLKAHYCNNSCRSKMASRSAPINADSQEFDGNKLDIIYDEGLGNFYWKAKLESGFVLTSACRFKTKFEAFQDLQRAFE